MPTELKIRCYFDYEDTEIDKELLVEYLVDMTDYDTHELEVKTTEELLVLLNENEPDGFYSEFIGNFPTCIRCEITPNE